MPDLTPLMEQYQQIKQKYQDAILLFRIGDFYETFNEDAKTVSSVLDITLTSKPVGKGIRVPLAGIPYHAVDSYLTTLTRAGYKVAICDQVEDPKQAKGIVRREVVRVVTPGTTLSETILEGKKNNFLVAVNFQTENYLGLGVVDLSTGDFLVTELENLKELTNEISRLSPVECLVKQSQLKNTPFLNLLKNTIENLRIEGIEDWIFNFDYAERILLDHFKVHSLDGFGCKDLKVGLGACSALLFYLQETQKSTLPHLISLKKYFLKDFMSLDKSTQVNLELTKTIQTGEKKGSLLWAIDETITAMGGRKLRSWLLHPLLEKEKIQARLDGVEVFFQNISLTREIREMLKSCYDLERYLAKIACQTANARDLLAIGKTLSLLPPLVEKIKSLPASILKKSISRLELLEDLTDLINRAIVENPPLLVKEGKIIKSGFHPQIDELRGIIKDSQKWILQFEAEEKRKTGIGSLKVRFNNVFGYYIEVTKPNLHLVPPDYIRKQTISTGERFITEKLKEYEEKILRADEKLAELEYQVFQQLCEKIKGKFKSIKAGAEFLSLIDVLVSLAWVAYHNGYTKPVLTEERILKIKEGRHPVLEKVLSAEKFIPNDIEINPEKNQIMIITGPNMAGKSTYIRQVALIVLLAQMGSFVPAQSAEIGLVDCIFTRVGASDFLTRGQSTFMVEMNETANILNNATERSLIILDEIGRGTSTFDGISIAWAVAEYLHQKIKARTLFATHYHELTELALVFPQIKNYNIAVREWNDEVIFLRKILEGPTDKSYGIQVARLAGLPREVISRAKEVIANLEKIEIDQNGSPKLAQSASQEKEEKKMIQLSLFGGDEKEEKVIEEIKKIDINQLTPLAALNKLQALKEKLGG